jgi:hypothetical protein
MMAGGKKTQGGPDRRVALAPFNPVGSHANRNDLATAQGIARPAAGAPTQLIVQAIDENIRYTLDGALPTATFGFRLTAGNDPIAIPVGPNTRLTFVEESATAVLQYIWGS